MPILSYFGSYGRFAADGKDHAVALMSADTLVGDRLVLEREFADGKTRIWLSNRFGARIGLLDDACAGSVELCQAKGWVVNALLVSVYRQSEGPGLRHWGEVAILSYPQANAESFDEFTSGISSLFARGVRPEVELQQSSVAQVLDTKGAWLPTGRRAAPKKGGSVLLKDRLSLNDKMVEQARRRNPGCLAAGWAFIVLLVLAGAYAAKLLIGL